MHVLDMSHLKRLAAMSGMRAKRLRWRGLEVSLGYFAPEAGWGTWKAGAGVELENRDVELRLRLGRAFAHLLVSW